MPLPVQTSSQINVDLNIAGILHSLDYMPNCLYQDFSKWVLNHPNLRQEWLQLSGITGIHRLTLGLLDGLLSGDEIADLIPYTIPINTFNSYEIISDNLSIGLAYCSDHDTNYMQRRQVVSALNSALIARLRGADHE